MRLTNLSKLRAFLDADVLFARAAAPGKRGDC
jgi:hypothetical protein